MKGIIFDLDGVLVDSMPTHFQCWKAAFENVAGIRITERDLYLLEGMRGIELILKIFEQKSFTNQELAKKVSDEKDLLFKQVRRVEPFEGVREMVQQLPCAKAVVSGSGRRDVETILDSSFGLDNFSAIVTADDVQKGKPDPTAFTTALQRMGLKPHNAVVVENAPLGVTAANNAKISCFVALNNSPLARSDFDGVIPAGRIADKTTSLKGALEEFIK